ncbi:MAG: efflux RND transporter periplasmic adaptor subunit [Pseudomonadota bacterium]
MQFLFSRFLHGRIPWALLPLALLAACAGEQEAEAPVETSRPVKTFLVTEPEGGGVRNFPARIDAERKAELSFRVSGTVKELLIKEGDEITSGQVVARLDPTDFEIVVKDRQATFDKNERNFERAKKLIDDGFISQTDYDRLEAEFKNARAALDAARQDLEYTTLKSPFEGVIAKRHVQQFEEVQAKQKIVDLQNVTALEVRFDMPESIVRGIRRSGDEGLARDTVNIFATFEDLPGRQFPLTFKEVATKADAQTQTFEVTYVMQQLEDRRILPGMTATVTADLSRYTGDDNIFMVPVEAVVGDYKLDPRVWTVDPDTMTVKPQPVKVGRMTGRRIEVLEGLKPGERIVAAGTPFMVEGMKVTLLPDLEQAEPRKDEK